MSSAKIILQANLDASALAVMQNDWPAYEAATALPFHLVSHCEDNTLTNEKELRDVFDCLRQTLMLHRVTNYIRLVQTAERIEDGLITGSYITHLMAGGQRLIEPFTSQITLRRVGASWRAASTRNALSSSRWPLPLHQIPPDQT